MKDVDELEVLFVDDEPAVLDGIRRSLRRLRPRWKASFHSDPVAGLLAYRDAMASLDVVVCDLNMPQVGGLQFLQAVHEHSPHTVRIALSGQLDIKSMLGVGKHADCHVCKPVHAEVLCATIVEHWLRRQHGPTPGTAP
ncbi:MAG: response regulator [Planctomycetes bacterium]|nr:response regulator [Planctomycetota bacterium]